MSRGAASDPLHNFRFHVRAVASDSQLINESADVLQPSATGSGYTIGDGAEAGFATCSLPQLTLEHVEYREGTKTYTEKYPGIPSVEDLNFTRGQTRKDTAFYDWIVRAIEGANYRADLIIYSILRGGRSHPFQTLDITDDTAKRFICRNASPTRVKPGADMDATQGDVSMAELDCVYERFDIEKDTLGSTVIPTRSPASLAT